MSLKKWDRICLFAHMLASTNEINAHFIYYTSMIATYSSVLEDSQISSKSVTYLMIILPLCDNDKRRQLFNSKQNNAQRSSSYENGYSQFLNSCFRFVSLLTFYNIISVFTHFTVYHRCRGFYFRPFYQKKIVVID